jgi:hypothetical protein
MVCNCIEMELSRAGAVVGRYKPASAAQTVSDPF